MAQVVNIHLPTSGELFDGNGEAWINILSIPCEDIRRLTLHPLKWIRFVLFTVCGAKGELSTSPNGEPADYERITLDDIAESYYYFPNGEQLLHEHASRTLLKSSLTANSRAVSFRRCQWS
jgi:hypothetical protein